MKDQIPKSAPTGELSMKPEPVLTSQQKKRQQRRERYDHKWYSFYPKWDRLSFEISPASYFDNRLFIHTSLTQILILIALPLLLIFGAGWWTLLLLIPYIFFNWGSLYLHLPIYSKHDDCDPPHYFKFYFYGEGNSSDFFKSDSFWIGWGTKLKKFDLPWAYEWMRTSRAIKMTEDGRDVAEWLTEKSKRYPKVTLEETISKNHWDEPYTSMLYKERHEYTYTFKDGSVQKVMCTVRISEREWRQHWLRWTSWRTKTRRTIDVDFDTEVGEETGSWKGGVMGTGNTMKPGQTIFEALQHMMKTRYLGRGQKPAHYLSE